MEKSTGPRKVVVGTSMHNMFRPYPGLQSRLAELTALVDRMANEAAQFDGVRLDIAALPEMAVNGGKEGAISDVADPLEGAVLEAMGTCARRNRCYIVVPLYLADSPEQGLYSNAAALLDRTGSVVGIYRKVFPVLDHDGETAEGGITPGRAFPVFDCDFGRLGIQICYDMAFDEGWETLARKGAELIVWTTQWPGRIHASRRALQGQCYLVSSTWRNNACIVDPTGHLLQEIREDGVFVEQIDLDYAILSWQPTLRSGLLFREKFGERAGYRYSEAEDCGIFWSNDPAMPIMQMVRSLGFATRPEELARCREALIGLRGGPPSRD